MPSNYTIKDLTSETSAMNQMRNVVYHLIRFLQDKNLSNEEIRHRLKRMGKNIGDTQSRLYDFSYDSVESLIRRIYRVILGSKVEVIRENKIYVVEDKDCCLCKYHRVDISVPCDTLIPAMVSEILKYNNVKSIDAYVFTSESLGDISCIHKYEIVE